MELITDRERRRINRSGGEMRGSSASSGMGMFVFGLPFLLVGGFVFAGGQGWMDLEPSRGTPLWILSAFGLTFFAAGLTFWVMGLAQRRRRRRLEAGRRAFPSQAGFFDYPWAPSGQTFSAWGAFCARLALAGFMTIFLSMFNWWAFFSDDGNFFVMAIVALFDLVLLYCWWLAAQSLVRALKYGGGRVRFLRFPYAVGEPAGFTYQSGAPIRHATAATFTLRCVEEETVIRRSGNKTSRTVEHHQLWAAVQKVAGRELPQAGPVPLTFEIPPDQPGTRLDVPSGQPGFFWELLVEIEMPGVDLEESFPVPVYGGALK